MLALADFGREERCHFLPQNLLRAALELGSCELVDVFDGSVPAYDKDTLLRGFGQGAITLLTLAKLLFRSLPLGDVLCYNEDFIDRPVKAGKRCHIHMIELLSPVESLIHPGSPFKGTSQVRFSNDKHLVCS